jgi:hypothetical protein
MKSSRPVRQPAEAKRRRKGRRQRWRVPPANQASMGLSCRLTPSFPGFLLFAAAVATRGFEQDGPIRGKVSPKGGALAAARGLTSVTLSTVRGETSVR